MVERLRTWARGIRRDVLVLYLAARDPRVPWYAKALALATVAYALSPVDLIPDFIPVLGYLDDLILVPLGILLTLRLIPAPVVAELRAEAARRLDDRPPASRAGTLLVLIVWVAVAALVARAVLAPG